MDRRQLRKVTAELSDYKASRLWGDQINICNDYWNAIRSNDDVKLEWYRSMGEDVRHRVMNINHYNHALNLGITEYWFNEYGWLETLEFTNFEEISFRQKSDNAIYNYLKIAECPNGKWIYCYSLRFGYAGQSCGLGVYCKSFNSESECREAVLLFAAEKFEYAVKQTKNRENYKMPYCQLVLNEINAELKKNKGIIIGKKNQLQLF